MSMTVQQAIDQTRDIMNATGSTQWSDTIIKTWVGVAHWAEWADLLSTNNQFRMQTVNVSQDANGQFPLSSLNTGSGDTARFWFRILSVAQPTTAQNNQFQFFYRQAPYRQFPNPQPNTSLPYIWYQFGLQMQVMPVQQGQQMAITTNYRPPRADNLLSLSSVIDFPDGYENVIPWRAAILALNKGGSESQAGSALNMQYQILHDAMLQDLGRAAVWPIIADSFDDPTDWGSGMGS